MIQEAAPPAQNMIESLRHFGYELQTAVADIIDNSITHNARNIWLDFVWAGPNSYFSITDDGDGMTDKKLYEAMVPSNRNPLEERESNDLGRFGLGLKTASFSQCRRLTVFSKVTQGKTAVKTWDLDFVSEQKKWSLINGCYPDSEQRASAKIRKLNKGTLVLWEKMDRIVDDREEQNEDAKSDYYRRFDECGHHISMVFHRLMLGKKKNISLHLNGKKLIPWDPFLENKSELTGPDIISYAGGVITCEPWVLPHYSKLSEQEHDNAAGIYGWNDHQGFYLYRNKRLIIPGGWLDLGLKTEEHCKLARIKVDIPNSLDQEFQLDVLKSQAQVPAKLRKRFKAIAKDTRSKANSVFRWRGQQQVANKRASDNAPIWSIQETRNKRYRFKISSKHMLIKELKSTFTKEQKVLFKQVSSILEETVPTEWARVRESEDPDARMSPFEGKNEEEILQIIQNLYKIYRREETHKVTIRLISQMHGLALFPELIQKVADDNK